MGWYEEQGEKYRKDCSEKARVRIIYEKNGGVTFKALNASGGWLLWAYKLLIQSKNIHQ